MCWCPEQFLSSSVFLFWPALISSFVNFFSQTLQAASAIVPGVSPVCYCTFFFHCGCSTGTFKSLLQMNKIRGAWRPETLTALSCGSLPWLLGGEKASCSIADTQCEGKFTAMGSTLLVFCWRSRISWQSFPSKDGSCFGAMERTGLKKSTENLFPLWVFFFFPWAYNLHCNSLILCLLSLLSLPASKLGQFGCGKWK